MYNILPGHLVRKFRRGANMRPPAGLSALEVDLFQWARRKTMPPELAKRDVAASRLEYVATAIRQRAPRTNQASAVIAVAADIDEDYHGPNVVKAEAAYELVARELRRLGGSVRRVFRKEKLAQMTFCVLEASVEFHSIDYRKAYKRARALKREMKEIRALEEKPRRQKRQPKPEVKMPQARLIKKRA